MSLTSLKASGSTGGAAHKSLFSKYRASGLPAEISSNDKTSASEQAGPVYGLQYRRKSSRASLMLIGDKLPASRLSRWLWLQRDTAVRARCPNHKRLPIAMPPRRLPAVTGNRLANRKFSQLRAESSSPASAANAAYSGIERARSPAGIQYILATQCSKPQITKKQTGR